MIKREVLIREYVTALRQNNASIFIGSGMSMRIFDMNWETLMKPYAEAIGYPMKKEGNDYPLIAQSYVNCGNDSLAFKKSIGEKFKSDVVTEFHKVIARLPIRNYWTTNYDTLIENALNELQKHFDTIYDDNSFCTLNDKRENIVYKCHGDYRYPESIVITKKDYDRYKFDSFKLQNALNNELATSKILFLGYSFSDPDIESIISTLSEISRTNNSHLMITKRKQGEDARQQELWIKDIERYGINTLLIDDYNYIDDIIEEIKQRYMSYKIMLSGSAVEYSQFAKPEEAQDFIKRLGYELVRWDCSGSNKGHGLEIASGNGLGVGSFLHDGIAEATVEFGLDMLDYYKGYSFPKIYYEQFDKEKALEEKIYGHRKNIISKCGIVFFIFGNKLNQEGKVINADGVRKEFNIAVEQGKYVIPIGATGYMAKELADLVLSDFKKYNSEMPNIERIVRKLNSPHIGSNEIIDGIIQIIDILAFRPDCK